MVRSATVRLTDGQQAAHQFSQLDRRKMMTCTSEKNANLSSIIIALFIVFLISSPSVECSTCNACRLLTESFKNVSLNLNFRFHE